MATGLENQKAYNFYLVPLPSPVINPERPALGVKTKPR